MARIQVAKTVGDIMNRTPVTVPPGMKIWELIRRFRDDRPAAVAVVDSAGALCGIVTVLDLLRAFRPEGAASASLPRGFASRTVETVMRPGVITLEPTDLLLDALDLLVESRFHALPVVRRYPHGPELVGILEQGDLLPILTGERRLAPPPRAGERSGRPG
ncbi:MAG TPA: CBS domain-containing protein [Gemmatimonadales bacterium]|jgi:CBS domain-containing protein|nr:CBS domain-containing protein [Gemmatimonadales bacterium]